MCYFFQRVINIKVIVEIVIGNSCPSVYSDEAQTQKPIFLALLNLLDAIMGSNMIENGLFIISVTSHCLVTQLCFGNSEATFFYITLQCDGLPTARLISTKRNHIPPAITR